MGFHQNTGKGLFRTVAGRKFAEDMKIQRFMKIETYQDASFKMRGEICKQLEEMAPIVLEENRLSYRILQDILNKPGCTTKEKLDAVKLLNQCQKLYLALMYRMHEDQKALGVEPEKPQPKNQPPEFHPEED